MIRWAVVSKTVRVESSGCFFGFLILAFSMFSGTAWGQGLAIGTTGQRVTTRFSGPGGDVTHPTLAEHYLNKSLQESATSVGSYVGKARAIPGTVGSESYLGYIDGLDTYDGRARADSATMVTVTGPASGTATVLVGGHINGGIGIFGNDSFAQAQAWYTFSGVQNVRLPDGSTSTNFTGPVFGRTLSARDLFFDKAQGESDGTPSYDYSPRQDFRLIDVPLDANGDGSFWMQLTLETRASEDGDEVLVIHAAASDFNNTVNGFLEPMSASATVTPASAWQTNPFGTTDPFVSISPAPSTFNVSGITSLPLPPDIGDVPEPGTMALMIPVAIGLLYRRRQENM
jgi:hypothetical protein